MLEPGKHAGRSLNILVVEDNVDAGDTLSLLLRLYGHDVQVARTGLAAPVFTAAKEIFDQALADGRGDLDIACVHDQISGVSALEESQ